IIVGIVVIVLALMLGITFGSGLIGGSKVQSVTIPNIVGMLTEDAKKELEKLGLKLNVIETVESDKEEGTILEMSPEADGTAKKGDTINVKVSGGLEKITVPDLRDREINYIKDFLDQKGLKYNITEEYNDSVEYGYLIRQSPDKGTEVPKGSIIELTISKGPEVKYVSVSNYLGQNVDSAKSELEGLGLVVKLKEQQTDNESENGLVLNQTIEAGTKVSSGSAITLTYGKYTETSIDISQYISVGMRLDEAVSSLSDAGISYTISGGTPQDGDMSSYVVKGFNSKIKKGESVKIQISKITSSDNNGNNGNNGSDVNDGEEDQPTNTKPNTDLDNTDNTTNSTYDTGMATDSVS
ncbi:MAG: PASTA domain-containing protein, partial [Clostridia bacterium]